MSLLVKLIKWLETLNGGKEYPWWCSCHCGSQQSR